VGRYPELKPGDYVMLAISDNGTGMSEAVKTRLFEPFFTTKPVGQGTGLGLSTCYGIVKQSGGHISVYSEQGRGTTFKIYLPQVETPTKVLIPHLDTPDLPRGKETILLVEDDPGLREMAGTLLRRLGYTVFTAGNGVEALSLKHEAGTGHIDLLFTDVVMPHMSGKELADRVRALYPLLKFCSPPPTPKTPSCIKAFWTKAWHCCKNRSRPPRSPAKCAKCWVRKHRPRNKHGKTGSK